MKNIDAVDIIENIIRIGLLLVLGIYLFFSWKYSNSNAENFIKKARQYHKYNYNIPIPEHDGVGFNKVRFTVKNEFQEMMRSTIKHASLNDIKSSDKKVLAAAALVAIAPGDEIICEISDRLKIKQCEKEFSFVEKKVPLTIRQVKEILKLPDEFYEK